MSQPPHAPWPRLVPPAAQPRHAAAPQPAQPAQPAQQLLPLPPPAPGPSGLLRPPPTTYPVVVPQSPSVSFSMQPLLPLSFDATRPPPPIPSYVVQPSYNGQLKRRIDPNGNDSLASVNQNNIGQECAPENLNGSVQFFSTQSEETGSSKTRKPEGPEVSEAHCESCAQRELRINGYKHKMEGFHNEEETHILQYKKKLQEYEIGRDILKTIVGSELFAVFDNLIEGRDQSLQVENSGSFTRDSPTVSKQALLQLIQVLLAGDTSDVMEPVPSTSRQHAQASNSEPARYGVAAGFAPSAQSQEFGARALPTMPSYPVAGSSGYGAAPAPAPAPSPAPAPAPAPPPAAYPVFHPAIPPPQNRPYYGPGPASGAPNMPYNGTERAPGPGPAQRMQTPRAAAALRPAANAPNYHYMGRYPQPPYFPPYQ